MACSLVFLYCENSCIRGEPDQAPRSATPDLRLHCLHVLHKGRCTY